MTRLAGDRGADLEVESAGDLTPAGLLGRVRGARAAAVAAEVELFVLAAEWADAHPDLGDEPHARTSPGGTCSWCGTFCPAVSGAAAAELGDFNGACPQGQMEKDDDLDDPFVPAVAWHAAAPLGAAIGRTTHAGRLLMRDALLVRHRLPRLWGRVVAAQVEPWRARRVAAVIVHQPRHVSDWLDVHVSPVAHTIGVRGLDRLLDEARLRLEPERREAEQLEALDARHATFDRESVNHTGVAEMALRGDWVDIDDFDRALSEVAAALAVRDEARGRPPESLDVRRSRAVGVLADPGAALALLRDPAGTATPAPDLAGRPDRHKIVEIVCHLTPTQLAGLDPVMRVMLPGRTGALGQPAPMLTETVRSWCGRDDVTVRVLPLLDLGGHRRVDAYEVPVRTERRVGEIAGTCAFPWCDRAPTSCECDHVVPYDQADPSRGGATCECNLAPLCRHHHRLKTFVGWSYTPLEPGVWLWRDPHGQQFLRDRAGTRDVTRSPLPKGDGCHRGGAPPPLVPA